MSNLVLDYVREENTDFVRNILAVLRLNAQNQVPPPGENAANAAQRIARQNEANALLDQIGQRIENRQPDLPELEAFAFNLPAQNLIEWKNHLQARHIQPEEDVHYRKSCQAYFKNTAEASWKQNEITEGNRASDNFRRNNANATEEQLRAEFNRGAFNAREHNRDIGENNPPVWEILAKEPNMQNDCKGEDVFLRFMDIKHLAPDWYKICHNLKEFGEGQGYTGAHFRHALTRYVMWFCPDLRNVIEGLNHNEMARFLLKLTAPEPKFDRIQKQMNALIRPKGESIRPAMAYLSALANALHSDTEEPERTHSINRVLYQGLVSFTTGQTRTNILEALEQAKRENQIIQPNKLISGVEKAETRYGRPSTALTFCNQSENSTMLFNVSNPVSIGPDIYPQPVSMWYNNRYNDYQPCCTGPQPPVDHQQDKHAGYHPYQNPIGINHHPPHYQPHFQPHNPVLPMAHLPLNNQPALQHPPAPPP